MKKRTILFKSSFLILMVAFIKISDSSLIMMTNISCYVDSAFGKLTVCELTPVRKGIQFMNFACNLEQKLDNLTFRANLQKIGNGPRKMIDATEDYCKVTSNEATSTVMTRLFPSIRKHGTLFSKCPISGNISLMKYPVDFSFVPMIMSPGNYRLTGTIKRKATPKKALIIGDLYFNVRSIFKNH